MMGPDDYGCTPEQCAATPTRHCCAFDDAVEPMPPPPVPTTMNGYKVRDAIDRGEAVLIQFCDADGHLTWERADRSTDTHPDGIPSSYYAETFGQVVLSVCHLAADGPRRHGRL